MNRALNLKGGFSKHSKDYLYSKGKKNNGPRSLGPIGQRNGHEERYS